MNRGIFSVILYLTLLYLIVSGLAWTFTGVFDPRSLDVLTQSGRVQFALLFFLILTPSVFILETYDHGDPIRIDIYNALFPTTPKY